MIDVTKDTYHALYVPFETEVSHVVLILPRMVNGDIACWFVACRTQTMICDLFRSC